MQISIFKPSQRSSIFNQSVFEGVYSFLQFLFVIVKLNNELNNFLVELCYGCFFFLQTLTTELLITKSIPSLRLGVNTQPRLISHRNLLRMLGCGPLRGHAVIQFIISEKRRIAKLYKEIHRGKILQPGHFTAYIAQRKQNFYNICFCTKDIVQPKLF